MAAHSSEMLKPIRTFSRVTNHLFVGGFLAAQDLDLLKELGITRIIVIRDQDLKIKSPAIKYLHYVYQDQFGECLHERFDEIADMIEVERFAGGNTFVCCQQGMSRSIAAVLAYLIKYTDQNLRNAYAYMRYVRPCLQVNDYFLIKLTEFELRIRNVQSVRPCYMNGVLSFDGL